MLYHVPLLFLAILLLVDAKFASPITDEEGYVYKAFHSQWRHLARKYSKTGKPENFIVRLFQSEREWSVQFENVTSGYSFSRYCEKKTMFSLIRTLNLLVTDAKCGFSLPF